MRGDKDINFTDEFGNEFFVKVRANKVEVFRNKTKIEDVRFYVDELEDPAQGIGLDNLNRRFQ
jgi:hypothetical protein